MLCTTCEHMIHGFYTHTVSLDCCFSQEMRIEELEQANGKLEQQIAGQLELLDSHASENAMLRDQVDALEEALEELKDKDPKNIIDAHLDLTDESSMDTVPQPSGSRLQDLQYLQEHTRHDLEVLPTRASIIRGSGGRIGGGSGRMTWRGAGGGGGCERAGPPAGSPGGPQRHPLSPTMRQHCHKVSGANRKAGPTVVSFSQATSSGAPQGQSLQIREGGGRTPQGSTHPRTHEPAPSFRPHTAGDFLLKSHTSAQGCIGRRGGVGRTPPPYSYGPPDPG